MVRGFFFAGFFAGFHSFLREVKRGFYLSVLKGTRTGKNTFLLKPTNWLVELWWNFGGTLVELWWNFGGTLTELSFPDNQRVVAFFGTIVELSWNFGGTLVELWWNFGEGF